jgi:hypothetical protein
MEEESRRDRGRQSKQNMTGISFGKTDHILSRMKNDDAIGLMKYYVQ